MTSPIDARNEPPFPWRLLLAALVLIAAGHASSVALHDAIQETLPHWTGLFTLAAVAGVSWSAWNLYQHRLEGHLALPSLLGSVLAGHWLALDLHHVINSRPIPGWAVAVGGALLFIAAALAAHRWRHELEGGRSLKRTESAGYVKLRPIRALVLIVSKPDALPLFSNTPSGFPVRVPPPGRAADPADPPVELAGRSATEDIETLQVRGLRWNWQQTLRALEPHAGNLRRVHLVGSEDAYLAAARRFLMPYLHPLPAEDLRAAPAVDLERIDYLLATLRQITLHDLPAAGLKPAEIAVDITGGIKIASVAGAVLTLNQAVVCQYVQTDGLNTGGPPLPYIYDFRWDPSLVLH